MLFRTENVVRKLPVIGNKHKADGVFIKSAGRKESFAAQRLRHQVNDCLLSLALARADKPGGLIKHDVKVLLISRTLPPKAYRSGIRFALRVGLHLSLAEDFAAFYRFLCLFARKPEGVRDDFIQSFHHLVRA